MARKLLWLALGVLILAPVAWTRETERTAAEKAVRAADPDEVDPVRIKGADWTYEITYAKPEPIVVTDPEGEKKVYWYLVYTVTNHSEEAHPFVPAFTLFTDTAELRRAGFFPEVYKAIKQGRKIPFLENAAKLHGKLFTGPDNARTGVAIFAPLPRETDRFTLFVEGLSGLYVERPRPDVPEDAPEDQKTIRLRKTLALEYDLPGDRWWQNLDQPVFLSKKWTWR